MLFQFSVQNFRSIDQPQIFSMTSSRLKGRNHGLIKNEYAPEGCLLPVGIVYGANASGKSNLIKALAFFRSAVLFSHTQISEGYHVPRDAFALCPERRAEPSVFEIVFEVKGVLYQYGFSALDESFAKEWLYAFPKGRKQTWFDRAGEKFTFGGNLKGRNKVIADLVRPDSLFLSTAYQNAHEQLKIVRDYIMQISIRTMDYVTAPNIYNHFADRELDDRVIGFLNSAGTGIDGFEANEMQLTAETAEIGNRIVEFFSELGASTGIDPNIEFKSADSMKRIKLRHKGRGEFVNHFDVDEESAGTRRLLILMSEVFRSLDEGNLLVIDELDASVHTKICEQIIMLYTDKATNPHGAQLIATTHDTNLLNSTEIRRDEIWFVEKSDEGDSHFFSLNDIRVRPDENFEKGYLDGRFGAIPDMS